MKKWLSLLLVSLLICGMFSTTAFAAKEMFTTIEHASVSGVEFPIVGQKPGYSITSNESGKYTVAKVTWSEYNKDIEHVRDMGANDTFREGYYYFVFVDLEAKGSCTFSKNMTQTISEKTANKYSPSEDGKKVQIYTSYESRKFISKVELNVVMPVIGKKPTFAKVDTNEYCSANTGASNMTNGVFWRNEKTNVNLTVSNPFKADGVYTVCYGIKAKEGYVLTKDTKYTINGQSAKIDAVIVYYDSSWAILYLDGLVPGDGKKEISTLDISITAPKDGEKATYNKIDGTGYYSDNGLNGTSTKIYKNGIAWYKSASSYISPGTTETFSGNKEYTLKLSLLPKEGYKFGSKLTAKVNGKTATVETFDDGSVTISVKLTALSKEHKHIDSDWKTDEDNHWKVCTDSACGSITVEKEAHKDKNKDNKCDVCGYKITEVTAGTTEVTDTDTMDNNEVDDSVTTGTVDNEKTDDNNSGVNQIVWIVIGVVFVTLVAGAVVTIVLIKKKVRKNNE